MRQNNRSLLTSLASTFRANFSSNTTRMDAGALMGVEGDVYKRKVTIYTPAREAGQSGQGKTLFGVGPAWKLDFGVPEHALWENPLMGWASTSDPLENVGRMASGLVFDTKEDAIRYCEKHGFDFQVKEPNTMRMVGTVHHRNPRFQSYGDRFSVKRAGLPIGGLVSELKK